MSLLKLTTVLFLVVPFSIQGLQEEGIDSERKQKSESNSEKQDDYSITGEPDYESSPGYCVFAFGHDAKAKAWIVRDGDKIYVDRNCNGDLSDDGDPLSPEKKRNLNDNYRDADYAKVEIRSTEDVSFGQLELGYYHSDGETTHVVKLIVDDTVVQYAGWRPIFADSPESARILHFGGNYLVRQLRGKNLSLSDSEPELHLCFNISGQGKGAVTSLSTDAVPKDVIPIARIKWPSSETSELIETSVELTQRC